jgi:hypothetical protein
MLYPTASGRVFKSCRRYRRRLARIEDGDTHNPSQLVLSHQHTLPVAMVVYRQGHRETSFPQARRESITAVGIADKSSETLPRRHGPTRPAPITLLFHFSDSASPSIKLLPFHILSKWTSLYALLDGWKKDGIIVSDLWDVNENMPVFSRDWDARVRPGWVVELRCCNDESGYFGRGYDGYSDGYGDWNGSSEDGDDTSEDACGYETESDNGVSGKRLSKSVTSQHPWCFKRWRERVEEERVKREDVLDEPSWFVMLLWCTSVLAIVILSSILGI